MQKVRRARISKQIAIMIVMAIQVIRGLIRIKGLRKKSNHSYPRIDQKKMSYLEKSHTSLKSKGEGLI